MSPRQRAKIDTVQPIVVAALRARGWLCQSLAMCGHGVPDILAHRPADGRWALIEVKTDKGKLRPSQVRFQLQGWPVSVVRSVADVEAL